MGGSQMEILTTQEREEVRKEENTLLSHKEEILRMHRERLEEEMSIVTRERKAVRQAFLVAYKGKDQARISGLERRLRELRIKEQEIREARRVILSLVQEEKKAEELLLASYRSQKERPQIVRREKKKVTPEPTFAFTWPVMPRKGISAGYLDAAYEKRFAMEHRAIDIPVAQGTEIHAPASGIVLEVHDRGYGYSTVALGHEDDLTTVYGHVSKMLVSAGDKVAAGQVIALSGGRPGSRGAGLLTTGPHVHFEVIAYGQQIDPLYMLPPMATLATSIAY